MVQIDAHTKFARRWDEKSINMWKTLGNEYAILTAYPRAISDMDPVTHEGVNSLIVAFKQNGELVTPKTALAKRLRTMVGSSAKTLSNHKNDSFLCPTHHHLLRQVVTSASPGRPAG